jgi:tetrahydromethanopterin S-methyltransferase subunit E
MRLTEKPASIIPVAKTDRSLLVNGLTLVALGLSILFLNSWDTLVVRTTVGLFWGTFLLILNGPAAVKALRALAKKNDTNDGSYRLSPER